jgi:hypothetical protein
MLCYIAILAVVMNAIMLLFVDGSKICGDAIKDADMNREMFLMRKKWRNFVQKCGGNFELREDGSLASSANFAKAEGGKLIFFADGEKREYSFFPSNMKFEFKIEKPELSAPYLVIEVSDGKNIKKRIVACYEK